VQRRLWFTLACCLTFGITLAQQGVGSPSVSIPDREVRWNHYASEWTPQGIFFVRFRPHPKYHDHETNAALATPDGRERRAIGGGDAGGCFNQLSVSPDGTQLAHAEALSDENGTETCVISVVNTDGSGEHLLTKWGDGGEAPVWSPSGSEIAYNGGFSGGTIAVVEVATGARRVLAPGQGAHWSPDGRQLVFTSLGPAQGTAVSAIASDGSGLRQLTPNDGSRAWGWSPDGAQVLFERGWASKSPSIWLMRSDGSQKRRLAGGDSPKWSPRGDWIAFARRSAGSVKTFTGGLSRAYAKFDLFALRVGDGAVLVLGEVARVDESEHPSPAFAWAPEGGRLAVSRHNDCWRAGLYVVDLSGRARNLSNDCRTRGTSRNDTLRGTDERDFIWGYRGGDRIFTGPGHDVVYGGAGNDTIWGGTFRDTITGGAGKDRIFGEGGADLVLARDGSRDRISCGGNGEFFDRAVVDRMDRVSADCEQVSRR
jgi:hypothetical protein